MNRRDMLKTAAGLALAHLVPSWLLRRPDIDLAAFCAEPNTSIRYAMEQPFIQAAGDALHKYATDARIAIRLPASWSDAAGDELKLPPASRLPWGAGKLWRSWPKQDHIAAEGVDCPECDGRGHGAYPGIQWIDDIPIRSVEDLKVRRHLRDVEYSTTIDHQPGKQPLSVVTIRFDGGEGMLAGMAVKDVLERIEWAKRGPETGGQA